MKVLLLRDVPKLGQKGEEKVVSDGYARNFLLRQKLAVQSGTGVFREIKNEIQAKLKQQEKFAKEKTKLLDRLKNIVVEIRHPANDQGHLFAAISPQEIAESLERTLHISIKPDKIQAEEPIKAVGTHRAYYKVENLRAEFRVNVKSV